MFHRLSIAFLVGAVGLLGVYAWVVTLSPNQPGEEALFVVELSQCDLGQITVGTHEVAVRVTNPAHRSRQVLGMMSGCRPNCCFEPKQAEPVAIPSGGTISYLCVLDISKPGEFKVPIVLYLEDKGVRTVEFTLRGVAIAQEGRGDDCAPMSRL